MTQPVTVLISSRNRPIYLWACLDALQRYTRYPHRFVLLDLDSDDPLVTDVIRGFERRQMFAEVVMAKRNHSSVIGELLQQNPSRWDPWLAYIEADVVVEDTSPCWLERLVSIMEQRPRLAMLGSAIDQRDFVDPESVEHLRRGEDDTHWRKLLKADSPERRQDVAAANGEEIFQPHGPAGRLLLVRSEALREVGLAPDAELNATLGRAGYEAAVATTVKHRHLSLLHVYDYPDYDIALRDQYMSGR
jgi:GT2 family glycosyltransferase